MAAVDPPLGIPLTCRFRAPSFQNDPFADDVGAAETAAPLPAQPVPLRPTSPASRAVPSRARSVAQRRGRPNEIVGAELRAKAAPVPRAENLMRGSPLSDSYKPPAVRIRSLAHLAAQQPTRSRRMAARVVRSYRPVTIHWQATTRPQTSGWRAGRPRATNAGPASARIFGCERDNFGTNGRARAHYSN